MSNAILLAPGPVQLHPEVQKILAQPMIHHRTPEFDEILKRTLQNLKFLFQTGNEVFIHASSGSGGMESLLVNLLSPGDKVLALVSGKFGERWADMAETFGGKVQRLEIEWGKAAAPAELQSALQNGNFSLVLCQACETSTGTAHDIQKLAQIVSKSDALFLVDGIAAVGAYEIQMDGWGLDGLVAGSQKAVMLPAGLSFVSLSKKAWGRCEKNRTARYYFDLRKERTANQRGETFFSSPVSHIRALDFVLGRMKEVGLPAHFAQLKRRADFTRALTKTMGLELFSNAPSDSVTAVSLPPKIDGTALREHLEKKFELTLMGGQDRLKGNLRIGHMGYITDTHLLESMHRLALGLKDFGYAIDPERILEQAKSWLKEHLT